MLIDNLTSEYKPSGSVARTTTSYSLVISKSIKNARRTVITPVCWCIKKTRPVSPLSIVYTRLRPVPATQEPAWCEPSAVVSVHCCTIPHIPAALLYIQPLPGLKVCLVHHSPHTVAQSVPRRPTPLNSSSVLPLLSQFRFVVVIPFTHEVAEHFLPNSMLHLRFSWTGPLPLHGIILFAIAPLGFCKIPQPSSSSFFFFLALYCTFGDLYISVLAMSGWSTGLAKTRQGPTVSPVSRNEQPRRSSYPAGRSTIMVEPRLSAQAV